MLAPPLTGRGAPQAAANQPYTIEYYYKVPWGHQQEFLQLFSKKPLPALKVVQIYSPVRQAARIVAVAQGITWHSRPQSTKQNCRSATWTASITRPMRSRWRSTHPKP